MFLSVQSVSADKTEKRDPLLSRHLSEIYYLLRESKVKALSSPSVSAVFTQE